MVDPMLPLSGLSSVSGKAVIAKFYGGLLSSDGGILVLREIEQRLCVADRIAACIEDPRAPNQITHTLADIIRFRLLMIAAGYEDGNDANSLRVDPVFKMAHDLAPSERDLCSQSTISRLENLPDPRALLRMGRAMVDMYCESFKQVPKRVTLDIDDTFDAVHGGQQLRLFNAHYDEYGFQPIVVFDGEGRFITAVLRPAKRPGSKEIRAFLRRLLRAIRANWPRAEIMLRGDSHYCCPEVLDWCRVNGIDYILGVAPTTTLRSHIIGLEAKVKARYEATPKQGKARGFKEFYDGAKSWSRVERVIARIEAGSEGPDTRFIVTCSSVSMTFCVRPPFRRGVARSSVPRSSLRPSSTIRSRKRRRSGSGECPRSGGKILRGSHMDARWTVKNTKGKPQEDGSPSLFDLAIPAFGDKNHMAVDPAYELTRN